MKRTKEQKGITLIALIITIVVLLILAAVAISSITNDNILGYAQNAAKDYNQAVKNEQEMLQEYVNFLNGNGGSGNGEGNGSGGTTYTAYTVGQEVKVEVEGVEHVFYVIEDSSATEEMVLLLAKGNINTTTLVQDGNDNWVAFSTESYWGEGTSPYDIVESATIPESHTAAKAAYDYGVKVGGTGRLMTYSEANDLEETNFSSKLYETDFWLGSAYHTSGVWFVYCDSSGLYGNFLDNAGYDLDAGGVRPVVEILKSKLS